VIRLRLIAALLLAASPAGLAPITVDAAELSNPTQAIYYPEDADATKVLDLALTSAKAERKLAVIVFGADWCHDSQGLARVLTSDAFKAEFGARFTVTFIDVGTPQIGEGRNLDLAKRFGIKRLEGTPSMVVISPKGKRLNSKSDAVSWRNADSRPVEAIFSWFRKVADKAR
jgi:thiol-disulfide isomerase/thioredoxin